MNNMALPPPPQKQDYGGLARLAAFNGACCHELYYILLFDRQFVPYCTTKYSRKLSGLVGEE